MSSENGSFSFVWIIQNFHYIFQVPPDLEVQSSWMDEQFYEIWYEGELLIGVKLGVWLDTSALKVQRNLCQFYNHFRIGTLKIVRNLMRRGITWPLCLSLCYKWLNKMWDLCSLCIQMISLKSLNMLNPMLVYPYSSSRWQEPLVMSSLRLL